MYNIRVAVCIKVCKQRCDGIASVDDSGYLKVKLPNQVSSIAATVIVSLDDGTSLTKLFVSGEGLCSDPSHVLTFGLGAANASAITVNFLDGTEMHREGPLRNELVTF